ncbi:MAG: hypothetical protein JWO08_2302 [Verrucomicrobiaceae bacterium]|nr:hypothetical protein [Verrucomicrobiaceae bacterium]
MILRCLFLLLCLATPLLAQDPPKPAPLAEKRAAKSEWQWMVPSREVAARFSKLSEAAKTRLQAEFANNSEALQALPLKEYNARFEKALRAAVQEDEAKGLSTGGVPEEVFTGRDLTTARGSEVGRSGRTAASPEQRQRWEKLSPESQEKVKGLFRENRDRVLKMSDEERRAFFESNFKRIEEEDKPKGK